MNGMLLVVVILLVTYFNNFYSIDQNQFEIQENTKFNIDSKDKFLQTLYTNRTNVYLWKPNKQGELPGTFY